jgi:hypothetical protein
MDKLKVWTGGLGLDTPAVEELPPTPQIFRCAHCDKLIDPSFMASYNGVKVCYPHPDSVDMNCYDLVSKKGHPMPCLRCYTERVTTEQVDRMTDG